MEMTQEELQKSLELHKKWIYGVEEGKRLDLSNVILSNADLSNADLRNADLSNADLSNADLRDADLSNADLRNADLSNADLSNAKLNWSNLIGADLSHACLNGANLMRAYLRDARFDFSNLKWANTVNSSGIDVICVQLNTSDQNRQIQYYVQLEIVTAGCFSGTLDDLKKAVSEKHEKDSIIYKRYQIALKTIDDILDTYKETT